MFWCAGAAQLNKKGEKMLEEKTEHKTDEELLAEYQREVEERLRALQELKNAKWQPVDRKNCEALKAVLDRISDKKRELAELEEKAESYAIQLKKKPVDLLKVMVKDDDIRNRLGIGRKVVKKLSTKPATTSNGGVSDDDLKAIRDGITTEVVRDALSELGHDTKPADVARHVVGDTYETLDTAQKKAVWVKTNSVMKSL
jgi:seryl-tRNA synthetase